MGWDYQREFITEDLPVPDPGGKAASWLHAGPCPVLSTQALIWMPGGDLTMHGAALLKGSASH